MRQVYGYMRRMLAVGGLAVFVFMALAMVQKAQAAETVAVFLKADGTDIIGEPSQTSLGRENSIEATALSHHVGYPEGSSTIAHGTIQITKRLDRSTPLLYKAMVNRQEITGDLKFYRPNPAGDGTTQHFYTISLHAARIVDIRPWVPDALDPVSNNFPPMEQVSIAYGGITWSYLATGASSFSTGK